MGYYKKIVECNNMTFEYKYFAVRNRGKKIKGREANSSASTDGQKKINKKISAQKRLWTACCNFEKNDYWITLTYRAGERPKDIDTGHKNLQKLIRKIRDYYKRQDVQVRYMGKTEQGKRGGVHHHVLIENLPGIIDFILEKWAYGGINAKKLYSENVYQLASYFAKDDSAAEQTKYITSRKLRKPKITVEHTKAATFRKDPKEKKNCVRVHLYNDNLGGYEYQEHIYYRRN